MRYILIPDVHGRDFWRKPVGHRDLDDIVVFLGDYVDPYPNEKITNETAMQGLIDIIELKKSDPNHIVLLLGNHDMGYLLHGFCNARHWSDGHDKLHDIFMKDIDLFDICYMTGDYLISHAGVYSWWLNERNITLDDFKNFNNLFHDPESCDKIMDELFYVDKYRGGWFPVGSPVWADIQCALNEDIDMKQIVGHTQLKDNPIQINNVTCIDCRRIFILEDGTLKEKDGTNIDVIKYPQ